VSNRSINLTGWILFVISALAFIVAGYRSGDMIALLGGIFFLVACLVFMIPYFRRSPD
jgi:F0F1-type ATP synthase assembly protein I